MKDSWGIWFALSIAASDASATGEGDRETRTGEVLVDVIRFRGDLISCSCIHCWSICCDKIREEKVEMRFFLGVCAILEIAPGISITAIGAIKC